METNLFYDSFLKVITNKYGKKSQLVDKLLDILPISKEAIYRRLRGEVSFTIQEIATISEKLGISLDSLVGPISQKSRPFSLKLTNYPRPEEIDYQMVEEFISLLKEMQDDPTTEEGVAAKMIPDPLHLQFPEITRFYLFKWLVQYENKEIPPKFCNVRGTDRMLKLMRELWEQHQAIKTTYYVLDKMMIQSFVNDVKYFADIKLINAQDIEVLKKDLYRFIDSLEKMAISGKNDMGNDVYLYISNINFESGFSYINSQQYQLSLIRSFTLYDIASLDEKTNESAKMWMHSLVKTSSLISRSGAMQRIEFFSTQRSIIDSL